jgi:hypothetical protein
MTLAEGREHSTKEEIEEFRDMVGCGRPSKFILWEDEDAAEARESDGGVPCGAELPSRGATRGWEVCERCIRHPLLMGALKTDLKEGGTSRC